MPGRNCNWLAVAFAVCCGLALTMPRGASAQGMCNAGGGAGGLAGMGMMGGAGGGQMGLPGGGTPGAGGGMRGGMGNVAGQAMATIQMARQAVQMRQAMMIRLRAVRAARHRTLQRACSAAFRESTGDAPARRHAAALPDVDAPISAEPVSPQRLTKRERLMARLQQRAEQRQRRRLARNRDR